MKRTHQLLVSDGSSITPSIRSGKITEISLKVDWNHRLNFCLKPPRIMEIFIALRRMLLVFRASRVPTKLFPQVMLEFDIIRPIRYNNNILTSNYKPTTIKIKMKKKRIRWEIPATLMLILKYGIKLLKSTIPLLNMCIFNILMTRISGLIPLKNIFM